MADVPDIHLFLSCSQAFSDGSGTAQHHGLWASGLSQMVSVQFLPVPHADSTHPGRVLQLRQSLSNGVVPGDFGS